MCLLLFVCFCFSQITKSLLCPTDLWFGLFLFLDSLTVHVSFEYIQYPGKKFLYIQQVDFITV